MSSRTISVRLLSTALAAFLFSAAFVGCSSAPPPKYEWIPEDAEATGVDPAVASPGASVEIQTLVGEHFFSAVAIRDSSGLTVEKKEDWSFADPVPPPGVLEQLGYRFDQLSLLRAAEYKEEKSKSVASSIVLPVTLLALLIGYGLAIDGISN